MKSRYLALLPIILLALFLIPTVLLRNDVVRRPDTRTTDQAISDKFLPPPPPYSTTTPPLMASARFSWVPNSTNGSSPRKRAGEFHPAVLTDHKSRGLLHVGEYKR
jgi:hypothetical protein